MEKQVVNEKFTQLVMHGQITLFNRDSFINSVIFDLWLCSYCPFVKIDLFYMAVSSHVVNIWINFLVGSNCHSFFFS